MATATKPAAAGHRARLTGGLATAIAEKGYAAVTIADVVRVARVSKRTFYEHFPDKEACFLALYAETSDELLEVIATAAAEPAARGASASTPPQRVLQRVASEPALMRAALLEIQAAGPRARDTARDPLPLRRSAPRALEAAAAEEPGNCALSPALATALVGGLNELVLTRSSPARRRGWASSPTPRRS